MNSESFISSFLNQDRFVIVNELLIKALDGDCTTAVVLSRLISLHRYYSDNNQLLDGYFFQTVKEIEGKLGINDYHQRKSISKLEEKEILKSKLIGSPPIRYFKLDFNRLEKLIMKEIPLNSKPKKKLTEKTVFYSKLNDNEDWFKIDSVRGNINRDLAEFMFAFKKATSYKFPGWNPENYGILSRYFNKVYIKPNRPFDYRKLGSWLQTSQSITIKNFIKFDEMAMEDGESPLRVDDFLKENE